MMEIKEVLCKFCMKPQVVHLTPVKPSFGVAGREPTDWEQQPQILFSSLSAAILVGELCGQ